MEQARFQTSLSLGLFSRSKIISTIKEDAHFSNLRLEIKENRGILISHYDIKVFGQLNTAKKFVETIHCQMEDYARD
jgi:hypothetical protein